MNFRCCLLAGIVLCLFVNASTAASAAEADEVAGVWRWKTEFGERTINSVLKLTVDEGAIKGDYKNDRGSAKVAEPKFENGELTFRLEFERDGNTFAINFAGKPKEDALSGNVSMEFNGEKREFPWEAKRSVEASDIAGVWTFTVDTPDGQTLHPTLKLTVDGEKLSGEYTSQLGNRMFEAKDLLLKDGALSFEIGGDVDGQSFTVKYKGQPRGDNMAGTIDYDFDGNTGQVEFKGKRADLQKEGDEK